MSIETMTKLATYTVGSTSEATVTFSNIPQTYSDLKLIVSARSNRASNTIDSGWIYFNNDTTSTNYTKRRMWGDGSTSYSATTYDLDYYVQGSTATTSTFSNFEYYIPNYSEGIYKSYSVDSAQENNAQIAINSFAGGLWSNTSAITSITFDLNNGDFVQFSTFTLYGIKNARKTVGNSIKATGGNISFDGTYVVHTFTSSGTFTPTANLTADYLVVAGGGGSGRREATRGAGGAGAGGLRCTTGATGGGGTVETKAFFTASNNYLVTIGAGGAGNGNSYTTGTSGSDSSISGTSVSIASKGGGASNSGVGTPPTGGSGAGANSGGDALVGSGTANQGYAGGACGSDPRYPGGGGGGAGAVGGNASNTNGGNGGAGVATAISGTLTYYAGGGGGGAISGGTGGTGGTGGGGNGSVGTTSGTNGTANTGGGGGGDGGGAGGSAMSGGSGIVIIRYKA